MRKELNESKKLTDQCEFSLSNINSSIDNKRNYLLNHSFKQEISMFLKLNVRIISALAESCTSFLKISALAESFT